MKRGFTLIELLVVISIITLLVSIIIPSLDKARLYSKQVTCMTNVAALCKGLSMYETANPGWLPLALCEQMEGTAPGGQDALIVDVMKTYIESPRTWRCPSDDQGLFENPKRRNSYEYLGVLLVVAAQSPDDLANVRRIFP
jgi:prepilin-type N-terminal cleavage/methylation domain-containing protein